MANIERFYKLSEEEREAKKLVLKNIQDLEEDMKQLNIDPTPLIYDEVRVLRISENGIIVVEPILEDLETDDDYWMLAFATFRGCAEFVYMNIINKKG